MGPKAPLWSVNVAEKQRERRGKEGKEQQESEEQRPFSVMYCKQTLASAETLASKPISHYSARQNTFEVGALQCLT